MPMLSDDDLNLRDLTDEELERAWELWFDLAQTTNESDPPYEHGVFMTMSAPVEEVLTHRDAVREIDHSAGEDGMTRK
jgi:hypothetical protein